MLRFSGAGVSDVGLVRAHNEDSAFVGPYVALVADGVGGAAAGEVASATATYVVAATALARFGDDARVGAARRRRGRPDERPPRRRATTRAGPAWPPRSRRWSRDGERIVLGHVGDSRAYLLRRRCAGPGLPRPHRTSSTWSTTAARPGRGARSTPGATWCSARSRPTDGASTTSTSPSVDARAGDRLLLCSDGLTDLVPRPGSRRCCAARPALGGRRAHPGRARRRRHATTSPASSSTSSTARWSSATAGCSARSATSPTSSTPASVAPRLTVLPDSPA